MNTARSEGGDGAAQGWNGTADSAASLDAATLAFREFLRARRHCNSLPVGGGDPGRARAARRAYAQAVTAMRQAPIASPRGARAAISYLMIELESVEPGPWCVPIFRNVMHYLRQAGDDPRQP